MGLFAESYFDYAASCTAAIQENAVEEQSASSEWMGRTIQTTNRAWDKLNCWVDKARHTLDFTDDLGKNLTAPSRGHCGSRYQVACYSKPVVDATFALLKGNKELLGNELDKSFLVNLSQLDIQNYYENISFSGSCVGNCLTLMQSSLLAQRVLGIMELREIERSSSFVTHAMTFQLSHEIMIDLYLIKYPSSSASTPPQNFEQSVTDIRDPVNAAPETFWHCFGLMGLSTYYYEFPLHETDFAQKWENLLNQQDTTIPFSGNLLITVAGRASEESGHAFFIATDASTATHYLYDNNRGYFEFKSLQETLKGLQMYITEYADYADRSWDYINITSIRLPPSAPIS